MRVRDLFPPNRPAGVTSTLRVFQVGCFLYLLDMSPVACKTCGDGGIAHDSTHVTAKWGDTIQVT